MGELDLNSRRAGRLSGRLSQTISKAQRGGARVLTSTLHSVVPDLCLGPASIEGGGK